MFCNWLREFQKTLHIKISVFLLVIVLSFEKKFYPLSIEPNPSSLNHVYRSHRAFSSGYFTDIVNIIISSYGALPFVVPYQRVT